MNSPKRILIADDEELNRILLREMLGSLGHDTEVAENGAQTLMKLDAGIDMVLLDLMMPDMDGFEVARRIRELREFADIPIIMVTAMTSRQDRLSAVEAGANDFIAKPVDITELRIRTESLLKIKENRDSIRQYQKELEEMVRNLKKLTSAIEQSADHIMITDADGIIEYVNPAFEKNTGYTREEVIGKTPFILNSGRHNGNYFEQFWNTLRTGETFSGIMINRKKTKELYYEEKSVVPIRDQSGIITHFVSSGRDITTQKLRSETTGLPGKILFREHIENALGISRRRKDYRFAVLVIDIDEFNAINSSYGYASGDRFLHLFASRIGECLGPEDLLSHTGADEFGILLENIGDAGHAVRIAEAVQSRLADPFVLDDEEVFCSASIGVVISTSEYTGSDDILRDAGLALKRAILQGKSRYKLYDESMLSTVTGRFQMERSLRRAMDRNEFLLYYQPVISLKTGCIESFEGLLRWNQPGKGMTLPDEFIPILEESGLIIPVGEWVLRRACTHTMKCHHAGHGDIQIAVNLSAVQFRKENLYDTIEKILRETGLQPGSLKLEITESTTAHDPETAIAILNKLKSLGITLLIDDFGTGYSNLSYLKRFPIDNLKIDRSFVRDIPYDPDSISIARTIIAMAHSLNLEVLAEGVETDEQLSFLRNEGCDYAQGFLISRPVAEENCEELLRKKALI